jgi:acetoin utilization deacetylase AcuC-like enzyme
MMHIAFDPCYAHQLPEGHRFPMLKYELIPAQLLHRGIIKTEQLFAPKVCADDIILLTHDEDYLQQLHQQTLSAAAQRRIGFPQSPALTYRELVITQGTIDCTLFALKEAVALNVAGGTHHAFRDRGEGFCLLNDQAVAANYLLHKGLVNQVMIIDLDVHQGNGTAAIFNGVDEVFTFSMHGAHNYPFHKEQSDCDIALPDGIEDDAYLEQMNIMLPVLLERVKPGIVFYQAGVDVLATDRYGKLKLTEKGCSNRDEYLFKLLKRLQIPCVVTMGGGYSKDIRNIVDAHCNSFQLAQEILYQS